MRQEVDIVTIYTHPSYQITTYAYSCTYIHKLPSIRTPSCRCMNSTIDTGGMLICAGI